MIDLKKYKPDFVLQNKLEFQKKEIEGSLTNYIEVVFNDNIIGRIAQQIRVSTTSRYEYTYVFTCYNTLIRNYDSQQFSYLDDCINNVKKTIDDFVEGMYFLFDIPKPVAQDNFTQSDLDNFDKEALSDKSGF